METFYDLRLEEERAIYSSKYHYSNQTQVWSEFKDLATNNFEVLYKWLDEADRLSTVKVHGDRKFYKENLEAFITEVESKRHEDNTIHLYRAIGLQRPEDLNREDMGVCWTWDASRLDTLSSMLISCNLRYEVRLHIKSSLDNVDWFESFYLFCIYGYNEKELRLMDPEKVKLQGYLFIQDRGTSNADIIKKWGASKVLVPTRLEDHLKAWKAKHPVNPKTGRIDCDSSLSVPEYLVKNGKLRVKFGVIRGDFECSNLALETLEGCPSEVTGTFECERNLITSLKYLPKALNYSLSFSSRLESLKGSPERVNGNFSCEHCISLTSLEGAPKQVGGNFDCSSCHNLRTLEGAPRLVGGDFLCYSCSSLASLEGAPEQVGGTFHCTDCSSIRSLKGAPQRVFRNFFCSTCTHLETLEGCPKYISGDFVCKDCDSLKTLENGPRQVEGRFDCRACYGLHSLKGAPEKVGAFDCTSCYNLESLEGSPREVTSGDFSCSYCNHIKNLEGGPLKVKGDFICQACMGLSSLEGAPEEIEGSIIHKFCPSLKGGSEEDDKEPERDTLIDPAEWNF